MKKKKNNPHHNLKKYCTVFHKTSLKEAKRRGSFFKSIWENVHRVCERSGGGVMIFQYLLFRLSNVEIYDTNRSRRAGVGRRLTAATEIRHVLTVNHPPPRQNIHFPDV